MSDNSSEASFGAMHVQIDRYATFTSASRALRLDAHEYAIDGNVWANASVTITDAAFRADHERLMADARLVP